MGARKPPVEIELINYTLAEAATAIRVGVDKVREFIDRNELVVTYLDHKPVIQVADLKAFMKSRPTEPPAKS